MSTIQGKILNKLVLSAAFLTVVSLTGSGCAKSSDVEAIGDRVSVLEGRVATLETDIAAVKSAAADAAAKAASAEAAANRAADIAEETNSKVSKLIKQNCGADC